MNNERITLTMKEQRMNDILVKLISGEIKTIDAMRLTVYLKDKFIERKKLIKKKELVQFHTKAKINQPAKVIQKILKIRFYNYI